MARFNRGFRNLSHDIFLIISFSGIYHNISLYIYLSMTTNEYFMIFFVKIKGF